MGVDPYLIAPTLKLAIAQRLSRRVKDGTGIEKPISKSLELMINDTFSNLPEEFKDRIPLGKSVVHPESTPGCATGMRGRVAIMEVLEVNEAIQDMILKSASEEQIYEEARRHGFLSMKEDAIKKALDHIIPLEEMNAFGTKIGSEEIIQETDVPVGNDVIGVPVRV